MFTVLNFWKIAFSRSELFIHNIWKAMTTILRFWRSSRQGVRNSGRSSTNLVKMLCLHLIATTLFVWKLREQCHNARPSWVIYTSLHNHLTIIRKRYDDEIRASFYSKILVNFDCRKINLILWSFLCVLRTWTSTVCKKNRL